MFPNDNIDTYSPQIPEKSVKLLFNSIVRIEVDSYFASGFFMKIPIKDRELKCLITNCHLIPQSYVESNKRIYIYYGKKNKEITKIFTLDSNERFIRCFGPPKDITVIEVKNYDYIPEDKFLLPDLNYKNGYAQYLFKKFYLAGYHFVKNPHYKERYISSGYIYNIYDNNLEFEHSIDRRKGSSGSPICLLSNERIVGIHKAHRFEGNFSINIATFIGPIIYELEEEYYNLFQKIKTFDEFGFEFPKNRGFTHYKTKNFFNIESIFPEASSLMDFNFQNFEVPKIDDNFRDVFDEFESFVSKGMSNMMDMVFPFFEIKPLFNMDFPILNQNKSLDKSLSNQNIFYKNKYVRENELNTRRNKTPISYNSSSYGINKTLTENYNYNCNYNPSNIYNINCKYNEFNSRNSLKRQMNKSWEPKLKKRKKKKKIYNQNNINIYNNMNKCNNINIYNNKNMCNNINIYNNMNTSNNINIYNNISTYNSNNNNDNFYYKATKNDSLILNNYKTERNNIKQRKSRNLCSYISKSYDNYQSSYKQRNKNLQLNPFL